MGSQWHPLIGHAALLPYSTMVFILKHFAYKITALRKTLVPALQKKGLIFRDFNKD